MTYNTSFMSDPSTTFVDLAGGANSLLGGWLFTAILVVVYIVIVASFGERHEIKKVMLYAAYVIMILGIVLWSIGFIPASHLAIPGFLIFIGIVLMMGG
ncbi:MAG: hypothetical protein ACTSYG_07545 [Candidatus Heimdallarchaeota archaeon]